MKSCSDSSAPLGGSGFIEDDSMKEIAVEVPGDMSVPDEGER